LIERLYFHQRLAYHAAEQLRQQSAATVGPDSSEDEVDEAAGTDHSTRRCRRLAARRARSKGNITGLSELTTEIDAKALEMWKD
jgi:hypothetical protein